MSKDIAGKFDAALSSLHEYVETQVQLNDAVRGMIISFDIVPEDKKAMVCLEIANLNLAAKNVKDMVALAFADSEKIIGAKNE